MRKLTSSVLIIAIIFCMIALMPMKTYAAPAIDDAQDYYWGEEYKGDIGDAVRLFKITITELSHVYLTVESSSSGYKFNVYDGSGNQITGTGDTQETYNNVTERYTRTYARIFKPGTYYVELWKNYKNFSFYGTCEKAVSLSKASIKSVKSTASKKCTVKWDSVSKKTGYQVQVAKDSKFTKGKKTKCVSGTSFTFTGLTGGTEYYVRVRAFTNYGDGTTVYGTWSNQRMVKIKK